MNTVYLFPFCEIEKGSRIAIYGAGVVGIDYLDQIEASDCYTVAFVAAESFAKIDVKKLYGYDAVSPDVFEVRNDFDYVVIATCRDDYAKEMLKRLEHAGVDNSKIVSTSKPVYFKNLYSFSQHGEDKIIHLAMQHMGYFKNGKLPSYIDIGAHHPYFLSNTALFYMLGCRGVNIEANPALIKAFEKERPEDINLCFGIGADEGEFPFYISDIAGLNTFKKENLEYNEFLIEQDTGVKGDYHVREVINLPVRKLQDVINEYCGGKWPDFMSIDIEGMEYETLSSCDLTDGPVIIAAEVNYDGDMFIEMLRNKGYFPYLWYRENIIFVKNECEKLVHAHTERN